MPQPDLYTSGPWNLVALDAPLNDWTGARYVIRAKGAPGGVCIIMGGLGTKEERANARLIARAPHLIKIVRDLRQSLWSCQFVADAESRKLLREILADVDAEIAKATEATDATP